MKPTGAPAPGSGAERLVIEAAVPNGPPVKAVNFLSQRTALPNTRIKDAMTKGAVWVWRGRHRRRLRRATADLTAGTRVALYYDAAVLALRPLRAICLADHGAYSTWAKPAGMLTQGTDFGDHCSLLRAVETHFSPRREAMPVHRLDREVDGVILVAHTARAAAALSALFRKNRIEKRYLAEVRGCPETIPHRLTIAHPLDGRPARTVARFLQADRDRGVSRVEITIDTGRKHQIRRHMDLAGYPVMGDPRYGSGNKNTEGMRLTAVSLSFTCPLRHRPVHVALPEKEDD